MDEEVPEEPKEKNKPKTTQSNQSKHSQPSESEFLQKPEQVTEAEQELINMGFPADKVKIALKVAFNNRQRAVQYLIEVFLLYKFHLSFLGTTKSPTTAA